MSMLVWPPAGNQPHPAPSLFRGVSKEPRCGASPFWWMAAPCAPLPFLFTLGKPLEGSWHIQQHWKVGAEQSRAFPPAPIPSTSSASGSFWSSQAGNTEPREPPTPTFSLIFPQQVNLHPFRALKSIIFTFAVDSLALLLMKTSRKAPQIQL